MTDALHVLWQALALVPVCGLMAWFVVGAFEGLRDWREDRHTATPEAWKRGKLKLHK